MPSSPRIGRRSPRSHRLLLGAVGLLVVLGLVDLVIGSDLLYEGRNVALVLDVIETVADHAIIADPGRPTSIEFEVSAASSWDLRTEIDDGPPRVALHELRRPA